MRRCDLRDGRPTSAHSAHFYRPVALSSVRQCGSVAGETRLESGMTGKSPFALIHFNPQEVYGIRDKLRNILSNAQVQ